MYEETTIFALATPYGRSSVAIIRISGKEALKTLRHLGICREIEPRSATLVTLLDSKNQIIDKAVILYFPKPNSFTGEDIIEIQCHGGKAIISAIIKELSQHFSPAGPGEFSRRAFLNGKMDLAQAEGLSDLIAAENRMQMRQALRQISGKLSIRCKSWQESLKDILAKVEAIIDFPEDLMEDDQLSPVKPSIKSLVENLESHIKSAIKHQKNYNGLSIAIIGPPNSGKSTLMNYLTKRDSSIISSFAGTTRDIIETEMELDGHPITLADTAGVRQTQDQIETLGINKALERAKDADIKILLIDLTSYLNNGIVNDIKTLIDENTILVLSKSDEYKQLPSLKYHIISTHQETGIQELIHTICEKMKSNSTNIDPPITTRERHIKALQKAILHLKKTDNCTQIELIAEEIKSAIDALKSIIGEITTEDVLAEIFNKFCIGK